MPTRSRRPKDEGKEDVRPPGDLSKPTAADWIRTEEDAFDLWLQRSLHQAFDAVAAEPIPEDILRLIEEDRADRERIRRRRKARRED